MSDTNPIEVMKNLERKVDELEVENKKLRDDLEKSKSNAMALTLECDKRARKALEETNED